MRKSGKFLALSLSVSVLGMLTSCQIPSPTKTDESPKPSVSDSGITDSYVNCNPAMSTKSLNYQIQDDSALQCSQILKDGGFDTLITEEERNSNSVSNSEKEKRAKRASAESFCNTDFSSSSESSGGSANVSVVGFGGGGASYNRSQAQTNQSSNCGSGSSSLSDDQVEKIFNSMEDGLKNYLNQKTASPVVANNWNKCNELEANRQKLLQDGRIREAEIAAQSQKDLLALNLNYLKTKDANTLALELAKLDKAVPKIGLYSTLTNLDEDVFTLSLTWASFKGFYETKVTGYSIINAEPAGSDKIGCNLTITSAEKKFSYKRAGTKPVYITVNTTNDSFVYVIPAKDVRVKEISLSPGIKEISLKAGESKTLGLATVTYEDGSYDDDVIWSSSDSNIAEVSKTGQLTGKKEGSVTVTVKTTKKPQKIYPITVNVSGVAPTPIPVETPTPTPVPVTVNSVTINPPSTITPKVGDPSPELSAKVTMSDNTTDSGIEWSSSDKSVAVVDSNGKMTLLDSGNVTITATSTKDKTKSNSVIFQVNYPPVSGKILFQSNVSGKSNAHIVNADGSGERLLSTNPVNSTAFVRLSNNGTWILFSKDWDRPEGGLFRMDSNGDNQQRMFASPALDGNWSYDDGKIVYGRVMGPGNIDLFTDSFSMNNSRQITNSSAYEFLPSFSPDGNKIVFASNKEGKYNLHIINSDGSGEKVLYRLDSVGNYLFPSWTPDGKRIVFVSNNNLNKLNPESDWEVFSIASDGTDLVNITNNKTNEDSVDVSPDGLYIVFSSDRDGIVNLYTSKINGKGDAKRITNSPAGKNSANPSWGK